MIAPSAARRFALFDRDGTIIVDKAYLKDPDEIEFAPGAIEGLRLLRDATLQQAIGSILLVVAAAAGIMLLQPVLEPLEQLMPPASMAKNAAVIILFI